MEVKIGVVHTVKELLVDTDESADEVAARVDAALRDEDSVLWLVDSKGRRIGVPSGKIAYVELCGEDGARQVGFGRH